MTSHAAREGSIMGHGYTYTSHPVACALALKVLEITTRDRLVEGVSELLGPHFQRRLHALADHPLVGEARGVGLIGGLELVYDKQRSRESDPTTGPSASLVLQSR